MRVGKNARFFQSEDPFRSLKCLQTDLSTSRRSSDSLGARQQGNLHINPEELDNGQIFAWNVSEG